MRTLPTLSTPQKHWPRHKNPCHAQVVAAAAQAKFDRQSKKAAGTTDTCVVCYETLVDPDQLPCGHSYCRECMVQLREKRVKASCPLCRTPLPPGAEQLYDLGVRVWLKIARAVGSNKTWPTLASELQSEMDGAILMLEEAMAQVCDGYILGGSSSGRVVCEGC